MRPASLHTRFRLPALIAALAGLVVQPVLADSVGQVQTTKYFAPETVALIKQRVLDVANHVPGASVGFRAGDTVSYIIQFTPIANGSTIGAGGYITDYIPSGTQVTGAWFVQPDGMGGFYQIPPPAPAQMADGFGAGGAGTYTATWTSDAYTASTCMAAGLTLATCTGNLAQLYADTGIFYSTDPRTQVFYDPSTDGRVRQWSAPTGNGYNVCPTRGNQLVPLMGATTIACGGGSAAKVSTHNFWDAAMTNAFGTTAASLTALAGMPPSAGIASAIDANGAGVPPFNSGSPVAGPDVGYQLDYTGTLGPWQRISYPGSMKGSNTFSPTNPAKAAGTVGVVATPTSSGAGFPLPTTTNAVRWAAGRLVVGTQSYVKISLLFTAAPPSGGVVNNSEVFGGDASPEVAGGNRDNAWVYHVPSVASNISTLYVLKEVLCVYDATGTCVANNGANLPTTGTPATVGPKVRYRLTYINTNNGTQHNVTICDQLPNTATAIPFANVTQINASPYIGVPTSPAAAVCGFGAGGTTFSYPTIPVMSGGAGGVIEFDVQFPVLTAGSSITNTLKAVSTEIPAGVTSYAPSNVVTSLAANLNITKNVSPSQANKGDTVTYTVNVTNAGGSAANITTLTDTLPGAATAVLANQIPSRFNYVATSGITINGTPISGTSAVVTPPAAPATTNSEVVTWTFPSGTTIPAGGQLVLTFTATAGGAGATNVMLYTTAYSNTATINCSSACVISPTAPNTATSKTTGTTAPVTFPIPNLLLSKTIDCVFAGGVCTSGSYTTGSNIPPAAKLRYKLAYTNPTNSTQTITLSDTVPSSTTSAGNLYVESGPDIRPSTPALSANPAAAGAPRGADAALTALAGSSVVTFTPVALAGGTSGTLYMDVQTNVAAAGVVTNTGSLNSTQRAAAGGAAVTSAVSATASALTIAKTAGALTSIAGGQFTVTYTVTVSNPGAAGVVLTSVADTLPKPLPNLAGRTILCGDTAGGTTAANCLAATAVTLNGAAAAAAPTLVQTAPTATVGQINTWTLGGTAAQRTLNAGQTMTLTFTAVYSSTVLHGNTYLNSATLNYTGGTATTGSTAPVTIPYNTLGISKAVITPASASITPNSPVTYAITITNTGSTPTPVTSVVDSLPTAAVGTIGYTSTTSVLVNGVTQTGVAGAPAAGQYTTPAPAAPVAGTQQQVTWTFPAAGTTIINPGQTMVITFAAQFGAIPTGVTLYNDVQANFSGGMATYASGLNQAPVTVPIISKITKTIDCVYAGATCTPGSYVDGTPIPVNAKLGYKIVYQNLSASPASGILITDILPTQTAANAIGNLVVNGIAMAAPPSAAGGATVTLLSGGTLAAGATGTITFDVQTNTTVGAGVTNTGNMTSTQDPVGVSSLATAITDGGNLSISKVVTTGTSATVAQGNIVSYTVTLTNTGSAVATLNTLTDTLPGSPAAAPGTSSRFTYSATGTLTLDGSPIAPAYSVAVTPPAAPATLNEETATWTFTGGLAIPAGQTFTLTFTATVGAAVPKGTAAPGATYYNDVAANYSGGLFGSVSANGQAPVLVPFNTLTMNKTIDCVYDTSAICQPYLNTPVPPNAKLRYQLLYSNISPLAQTVTVKDTLPATATAAGNLYVGSGPEVRPSTPALSVNAAVAGAPRAADAALTAIAGGSTVAMAATSLPGNSSGSVYIDMQTNAVAGGSVSNCASISTLATDTCATAGVISSTATASVQNVAMLNISKTTSTPNVVPGGTATYTITIINTGTAATTSLKVYDFLPFSGATADASKRFNYVAGSSTYTGGLPAPTITTSVAPIILPYSSNLNQQQVLWDFGNFALAAGATATITFNATVGTGMTGLSYYNSAREEYASAGISFNANVNSTAPVNVSSALLFLKTVTVYSDPVNGTTNPKFIPGALAGYALSVTNTGSGTIDNNTIALTDPIPANTSLFVSDIGGANSGPVLFSQGAASSTLTYTYTALSNLTDDLDFSSNNGVTWAYVPTPAADGCDPLVTNIRIRPKGAFAGNPAPPQPSFTLNFRVCVK
jgi:uncharacterized repeat protein (TIGR01451 family)/fimbrial isopeptide formation D2 family protein